MRTLFLTSVLTAFLSMAQLAATAFAETDAPVTPSAVGSIVNDSTGGICSAVSRVPHTVTGGCVIHASSPTATPAVLTSHTIFGEIVGARCSTEFDAHIDDDGDGWIALADISISHAPSPLNCTHEEGGVQKCSEADAAAIGHPGDWQITTFEDQSNGSLWFNIEICLENTSLGDVDGDIWARLSTTGQPKVLTGLCATNIRVREESVVGEAELDICWNIEGTSIRIPH